GLTVSVLGRLDYFYLQTANKQIAGQTETLDCPVPVISPYSFPFSFPLAMLTHETFNGQQASLSYCVQVVLKRRLGQSITVDVPFNLVCPRALPEKAPPVQCEVGNEDHGLLLELTLDKDTYPLDGRLLGKVTFLAVGSLLSSMRLHIVSREAVTRTQQWGTTDSESRSFEALTGTPARGETIPIRLCLSDFKGLGPSLSVPGEFSLTHEVHVVIENARGESFFKVLPVTLVRDK
ncbi:vacuolar protein sorting protein 26 related, partial [Kipferlia bialata]